MGFRGAFARANEERGTASVELVAVIPFLICGLLAAAQIALIGHAFWSAGVAARAGARAALVDRSATNAALQALPDALRRDAEVDEQDGVAHGEPSPRSGP